MNINQEQTEENLPNILRSIDQLFAISMHKALNEGDIIHWDINICSKGIIICF